MAYGVNSGSLAYLKVFGSFVYGASSTNFDVMKNFRQNRNSSSDLLLSSP